MLVFTIHLAREAPSKRKDNYHSIYGSIDGKRRGDYRKGETHLLENEDIAIQAQDC